ncbi:heterokaryon incompatibility protein [Rutstroemia sp. NJR-2017a BBW]|nr:heterokaryon incompatibility protein [Rutstroemia sp. NJR-2017a BBW]
MAKENSVNTIPILQDFDFDSFLQVAPPDDKPLHNDQSTSSLSSPRLSTIPPSPIGQTVAPGALEDYQLQLMLLEQQNKKRLMMARLESDMLNPSRQLGQLEQQQIIQHQAQLQPAPQSTLTAGEANSGEITEKFTLTAPVGDTEMNFTLSEEFTFMFRECNSSDVLQLLKDNWHHYSQWIDGAHMNWQNDAFLESSNHLKNSLGACLVKSAKGSLPLRDTVLPMIDRQLDEGRHIPAVDINDPQHPEWILLSYFGVIMKGDVHYYLRCLISISAEHRPDVDSVAYIYEQVQARYRENEELIRAAFYERHIIFIHSKPQGWMNMEECISRNITIESEYRSCSYLFRCLISPRGDPIALIVATATLITSSTKLEDVSSFFRNVSTALKDVNTSNAAQLLRPLQYKSIFPITNGLAKRGYDKLLDLHNTSWYIADRPLIRESFLGRLPLLALPIEDLSALEDLFRVLRLDGRILSKLTTSRTQKWGRTTTHWAYTSSLRKKSPFIKAMAIVRQIEEVRVGVATDISQTFVLNVAGAEILGDDVRGQVSLSYSENFLNLLMTEECAAAAHPPYELATLLADACRIEDPKHFSLLYIVLSNSSLESINKNFKEQGIYINGLVFDKAKDRYRAQRGDLMRIPSPFWGRLSSMVGSFQGSAEALWLGSSPIGENIYNPSGDRRLPMMRLSEDTISRRLVYEAEGIDGWDHIQYLGENMISKLLYTYLGLAYDPERDWTSKLRRRAGYKLFEDSAPCAAFTMRDPKIRELMTAFVIKYGQSQTSNWKENLRANPPVYHLDLAVNAGSRTSSFVITTSQVERMQQFMMHDNANESNSDVVVLIRVSDVYSENLLSIDLFVDPWQLFNSNNLTFEGNWIAKGTIQENTSSSTRKRRKLDAPSVSWATPAISGIQENALTARHGRRSKETFTHRALDSGDIRLLYLLPGETGEQLRGVIIHVPYKSPGAYRALSYVWGTDQRTKVLVTPDGTLQITLSLNKALQGLRHRGKPIILWVDAICINQKDNTEKAQQIRLLPKIFQNAASTYAFLEGGEGSDAAIEMLMQVRFKAACDEKSKLKMERADEEAEENESAGETDLGESTKSGKRTSSDRRICLEDWPENLPRVPESWKHRSIPNLDAGIWSSVGTLFRLPWFRRVWIIQEIVGAPHVKIVCDKWIIDWNDLHLAIEMIDREVQMSENDFSHLKSSWEPFLALAAQREWEARHYRWTLIMLLEHFRYAESTLSRDRLFALLGLASDGNEAEFEPDYDSPLEDIVLEFARGFVRQGRGMQMLYRAGLSHQSDRFPSWIPDWTVKRASSLYDSSEGGVSFAASGPQEGKIKCIPNTDELLVDGYEVDEIGNISDASNVEEEWEKYFKEVDTMIDSAILAPVQHLPQDLKWKVPISGVLWPKVAVSGGLDLKSSYIALRNYLYSKKKGKTEEDGHSVNGSLPPTEYAMLIEHMAASSYKQQAASYIAALQDTLYGWRFVVTKNGYVGVVPNIAKVGDVVAILKGGRVPFVLKKSEKREKVFRLIGECYIHGLMNGEGLSLPRISERKFQLY